MKAFANLRISMKLTLGFLATATITGVIGYIGISNLMKIDAEYSLMYEQSTKPMRQLTDLLEGYHTYRVYVRNLILTTDEKEIDQLKQRLADLRVQIQKNVDEYEKLVYTEDGHKLINQFRETYDPLIPQWDEIIRLALENKNEEAYAALLAAGPRGKEVEKILGEMVDNKIAFGDRISEELTKQTQQTRNSLLVIMISGVIVSLILGLFIARVISKPVAALEHAAGQMAAGNTDVNVAISATDEIGKTSAAFNHMVANIRQLLNESREATQKAEAATREAELREQEGEQQRIYLSRSVDIILKEMERFSAGDLTVQVHAERQDEIGQLFEGFNLAVANIRTMILQVDQAVGAAASAATQISSSSEELAAGSQQQSAQAHEVAAAVEEMVRTIVENARSASETAGVAQENGKIAIEGGQVVEQTVKKIRRIAEVVAQSATNIDHLGQSSQQIGDIVSVISDIADQTNLLALNAAIEAARAGEQGRGFAVVADEVRKLAERTTMATKEITGRIRSIQDETQQAVGAMKHGTREVEEGIVLADRAGEALTRIVSGTDTTVSMVTQIAAATEEQSATSEEISRNVEAISAVTNQSAMGVTQIARAADDLNQLTENLRTIVSNFNTGHTGNSLPAYRPEISRKPGRVKHGDGMHGFPVFHS